MITGNQRNEAMGVGDMVEVVAKPIARLMGADCLDEQGNLKPDSGCARRKAACNRVRLPEWLFGRRRRKL